MMNKKRLFSAAFFCIVVVQVLGVWYRTEVTEKTDEVARVLLSLDYDGRIEITISSSV